MKLCVGFGWFFIDNFGLMCSFGLALFVVQGMVHLHMWELVRCSGKSICEILNQDKVIQHVIKWRISRSGDVSGPQMTCFGPMSACWRTVLKDLSGSKNLLQRAILYRHKGILLGRDDWSFKPMKTICKNGLVFHWYLWIHQFVWARAVCGTRYGQSPWVGTSPVPGKIHMWNPELDQGNSTSDKLITNSKNISVWYEIWINWNYQ